MTDQTLLSLYAAALQGLCANPANAETPRNLLAEDALAIALAARAALATHETGESP